MTKQAKLTRMRQLAGMIQDIDLADLRQAATRRAATLDKIAQLPVMPIVMSAEDGAPAAIAALRYQVWAEARRSELHITLAQQTAQWLDARDKAREAFGKAQALEGLAKSSTTTPPKR